MMLAGNKGEWSEIYALLKIISDKQLYRGDGNLNKLKNAVMPIIKVLREESAGTNEYSIHQNLVIVNSLGKELKIPISDFQLQAQNLLTIIKSSSSTFQIPDIENFISTFNCKSLKANSRVKSDIRIVLHDAATGISPELGFSIKSQLGNASTLLNAGKTTNFIYKVTGEKLPVTLIDEVNQIDSGSKIKDRLAKISSLGRKLTFVKTEKPIFSNNLTLIDSALPKIMAELVYSFYSSTNSKLTDLVADISEKNPMNFDASELHPYYLYKVKRLLTDIALGMMPSRVWTGELEATGGYLVVKDDGEILAYHIYNRNDFEDYLLNNTKLDIASTSRHGFGVIYEKDDAQLFNLRLQVRFVK